MIDWADFETWLGTRLGPNTAHRRATAARALFERRETVEAVKGTARQIYVHASRDLNQYQVERGLELTVPLERAAPGKKLRRKLTAVSLDDPSYEQLALELASSHEPAACVLRIILRTGKRVSDVLRTDPAAITKALARPDGLLLMVVKGEKTVHTSVGICRDDWALAEAGARAHGSIALWVAPDGDGSPEAGHAAYQAVNRHLKLLAETTGAEGRVHLHRLRRTFIVRALSRGIPMHKVQRAVDHESAMTTAGYSDEVRVDWILETAEAAASKREQK